MKKIHFVVRHALHHSDREDHNRFCECLTIYEPAHLEPEQAAAQEKEIRAQHPRDAVWVMSRSISG